MVPRRLANLALLAAVATLLGSGIVAWLLPDTAAGALYVAHRVAGLAFVLALVWKYAIARRSLHRRGVRGAGVWVGLATAVLTVIATSLGLAWTTGLVSFDRPFAYSALNLHVIAGLALGALVVTHVLARGESRPALVTLAGRRSALRGLALLAASLVATVALDRVTLVIMRNPEAPKRPATPKGPVGFPPKGGIPPKELGGPPPAEDEEREGAGVGGQDELVFDGASFALNADRSIAFQLPAFAETVATSRWSRTADGWPPVFRPRPTCSLGSGSGACARDRAAPPSARTSPTT